MSHLKSYLAGMLAVWAMGAGAFDSAGWLGTRELLMREAERLRATYAKCVLRLDRPAENVMVPVECHPDGSIKTMISAARAQIFPDDGLVWGERVAVRELKRDKTPVARIDADSCVVDRGTKSGWIDGHAAAESRGTRIEGDGAYVSFAEGYIAIASNAVLRSTDFGIGRGRTNVQTVVSADRADYDRTAGVILLDGRARFDDAEYRLSADRAFIFLQGTNELKRIVALGSVAVTNGLRNGSCARAVYDRAQGKVTMYGAFGRGGAPARLADRSDCGGEVAGSRITFWTESEQVEVANAALEFDVRAGRERVGAGIPRISGGAK